MDAQDKKWWCTPRDPSTWELRREDYEWEISLGNLVTKKRKLKAGTKSGSNSRAVPKSSLVAPRHVPCLSRMPQN